MMGMQYGSPGKAEISATEAEFRKARKAHKDIHILPVR